MIIWLSQAEEEFNIEKGHLIQSEKIKIDNYYDRKEKQVELQRKMLVLRHNYACTVMVRR